MSQLSAPPISPPLLILPPTAFSCAAEEGPPKIDFYYYCYHNNNHDDTSSIASNSTSSTIDTTCGAYEDMFDFKTYCLKKNSLYSHHIGDYGGNSSIPTTTGTPHVDQVGVNAAAPVAMEYSAYPLPAFLVRPRKGFLPVWMTHYSPNDDDDDKQANKRARVSPLIVGSMGPTTLAAASCPPSPPEFIPNVYEVALSRNISSGPHPPPALIHPANASIPDPLSGGRNSCLL